MESRGSIIYSSMTHIPGLGIPLLAQWQKKKSMPKTRQGFWKKWIGSFAQSPTSYLKLHLVGKLLPGWWLSMNGDHYWLMKHSICRETSPVTGPTNECTHQWLGLASMESNHPRISCIRPWQEQRVWNVCGCCRWIVSFGGEEGISWAGEVQV